ncbi:hypothetical protein [Catellatospora methionotrophica]|uniref:hypothetical protein n=1 Tax=Catellatospora methionotrophica TaxID=121620 RepID=UPI0033EA2C62
MRSSRVLGYGLGVWLGMVGISLILLPAEGKHEALYESIKLTTMVALVLGFAVRYLRKRPDAAGPEGVLVGLVWAAVTTAGDLGLYLGGAFNIGLDVYFTDVASSYSVMPVITGLAIGLLAPKPGTSAALAAELPAAEPSATDEFAAMMAAGAASFDTPAAPAEAAPAADQGTPSVPAARTEAAPAAGAADVENASQTEVEIHTAPGGQPAPEGHAEPGLAAPEVHGESGSQAEPADTPEPSHAEATLAEAALVGAPGAEETDRPLYIPRGNC